MSHTRKEHLRALAEYLPGGRLYSKKLREGSNIYNFLLGLSAELHLADDYTRRYRTDIIPDNTIEFIDDWERAVGIPDACFPGTGDLNTRRSHVLTKLAALGLQTVEDFEDLAAVLGVDVQVLPGADVTGSTFPMTFPFTFSGATTSVDRFTIVIRVYLGPIIINGFPLTFPVPFGNEDTAIIECLFNRLKPANCRIIFEYI